MQFQYMAINRTGKRFKGKLEATDTEQAIEKLKKEGLFCLELKPIKDSIWHKDLGTLLARPIKPRDFTTFCRQLASLLRTGSTVTVALDLLKGQAESKSFQKVLADIRREVMAGKPFSDACQAYPHYFPPLFVQMVRAGELSGELDDVMEQLATYYEKEYKLREKVKSALMYPMIVGMVSIVAVTILLVYVIPRLVNSLLSSGQSIPWPTAIVLGVSEFLVRYWPILLASLVLLIFAGKKGLQKPRWRQYADWLKLKIPVLGKLTTKTVLARFSRTLAILLSSAVPVLEALGMVSRVVGNEVVAEGIRKAQNGVSKGEALSDALALSSVFPPIIPHMVRVGEQAGQLDELLHKLADFYEEEADQLSSRLSTALEPFLIVILGFVVGGILLAALLPMFEIYKNV